MDGRRESGRGILGCGCRLNSRLEVLGVVFLAFFCASERSGGVGVQVGFSSPVWVCVF